MPKLGSEKILALTKAAMTVLGTFTFSQELES